MNTQITLDYAMSDIFENDWQVNHGKVFSFIRKLSFFPHTDESRGHCKMPYRTLSIKLLLTKSKNNSEFVIFKSTINAVNILHFDLIFLNGCLLKIGSRRKKLSMVCVATNLIERKIC